MFLMYLDYLFILNKTYFEKKKKKKDRGYPSVLPVVQLLRYLILKVHRHVRVFARQGVVEALGVIFLM